MNPPKNSGPYFMRLKMMLRRLYSTNLREGQIEWIPMLSGPYFMFSEMYEYLEEKGHKIDVECEGSVDEIKKLLWSSCKTEAEIYMIKKHMRTSADDQAQYFLLHSKEMFSPEATKDYAIKLYKSELCIQYLIREFNRGKILKIETEVNLPSMWDEKHEEEIQKYLTEKTIGLVV